MPFETEETHEVPFDPADRRMYEGQEAAVDAHLPPARQELGWHGVWDVEETVRRVVAWYKEHSEGGDMTARTREQIKSYSEDARRQNLPWATEEKA